MKLKPKAAMKRLRLSLVLAVAMLSAPVGAAPRPNIVVLLADDLGWQDIGCYGGPVKTPALDALAASGTRFTQFYSGCSVCSPSRATLLTGRHHIRTGVYSWINDAGQRSHLLEREITLAELLKAQGYATAHVGKWHLGLPSEKFAKPTPDQHGFDHWFATWNNAEPSHRNPATFLRNGEPVGEIEGYSCQIVVDEAITWLDQNRDTEKPFFLNVWFHEPHSPTAAPDEIVAEYGDVKNKNAIYSGTIANTDRAVARLLARVREIAPAEDTLIVYFSDNGSYLRERVGNLRGAKGTNWEGGIRVPGIFSWPGKIDSGKIESTPAGLVDLLPTVCGLFGIEPPAGVHLDGSDLTALLRSDSGSEFVRHQPLFWHLQKSRPIVALRDGRWSLTADPDYELSTDNMFQEEWIPVIKSGGYTNWQLFDLEADPSQEKNLAGENPEVLARLKEQLLKINASVMADGSDWHQP